ncbi:MAG TPA: RNB domain-containing ribonuclease, partial [Candidatus Polarisedimenticolia bacterium]|nr:RNB domain-containing ribonuclease [Candidatus Polarisedimenticolia bacterium]
MSEPRYDHRALLLRVARRAMLEKGLEPDFSPQALEEANAVPGPAAPDGDSVRDLRELLWCSIDNDDSRDLDQLTVAGPQDGKGTRVMVAVAHVGAVVKPGSALDDHAGANTCSVYTAPMVFPMLPERLSNDLTSLNPDQDRLAMVVEFTVDKDGHIGASDVYPAMVRNHAKLAYSSVGPWLENTEPLPPAAAAVPGLDQNLRAQDQVARTLKERRHEEGALDLETIDVRALFEGDRVTGLVPERTNRAKELIEDFMIASNGVIARFLTARRFPVVRRVVRSPERWQRIVELAGRFGASLPKEPDARARRNSFSARREADPLRFPDLSLSVIKLLGRGEYLASVPGQEAPGHFGLAVSQYTHSTAPNRRYPDLITQRLLHAAFRGEPTPYRPDQLQALAIHCTKKEDDAQKVERFTRKSAAACLLEKRIGEVFDGVVTGLNAHGTW